MGNALTIIQIVLSVASIAGSVMLILVALGRWGGQLEAKADSRPTSQTSPLPSPLNGHAAILSARIDDLVRRQGELEAEHRTARRTYVAREESKVSWEGNKREHDDLWGAIKNLREVDNATTRRVDSLMGQ